MNSDNCSLKRIYCFFLQDGRSRVACIEDYLKMSGEPCALSVDDRINIESSYQDLFSEVRLPQVEALYRHLLISLKGAPYESCEDVLSGLAFLQVILATGLWKYRLAIGDVLERFARDYDRLDVEEERQRLHASAQRNNRDGGS